MNIYKPERARVPIKYWTTTEEYNSEQYSSMREQVENLASLPFAYKHIALMPDSHVGYFVPIGCVFVSKNVICPGGSGFDLGCGMCAMPTSIKKENLNNEKIKSIMSDIRSIIPVGKNWHNKPQLIGYMPDIEFASNYYHCGESNTFLLDDKYVLYHEYERVLYQLGTLGSNNHFWELQHDSDDNIWIMIHSGSRNLGKQVGDYYDKLAQTLNKKWYSNVNANFLPVDTDEGKRYIQEMNYCVKFAFANRKLMMDRTMNILRDYFSDISFGDMINIAHNYASLENHFGENVWVHRKGATLARKGTVGIIPGSQGTCSYIVRGKGNPDSFMSCSHGAGRVLGRKQAVRELDFDIEKKLLEDKGIVHSLRCPDDLDEATSAYKDIDVVMENQKDLVEIVTKLETLAVIKG